MNFYPLKFPDFLQKLFPKIIFKQKTQEQTVYLTFDDGPVPEITSWVLNLLSQYNAQATFFCIGNNIQKYPDIFKKIIQNKHQVGNHTFTHLNGWKTNNLNYFEEIQKTEAIINSFIPSQKIFRPPYGRFKRSQINQLNKSGYKIFLWTTISGDFNPNLNPAKVIKYITKNTKTGDIIVFHDSQKASKNLKIILPEILNNLHSKGYSFKTL